MNSFRNGLAGLVLLGASAGLGGCAHPSDTAALGILGMGLGAGTGSPGVFYAGAGATTYAAGQAQGQENGFQAQLSNRCFNSDWRLQHLRDSFSQSEHIAFVVDIPPSERGYWVSLTIFSGPNIQTRRDTVSAGDSGDLGLRKVFVYPPHSFALGVYTGVWRRNIAGNYLGQSTIKVNP